MGTYLLGKVGGTIKFDNIKMKGGVGGDIEPQLLFLKIAERNPQHNFILISSDDLESAKHTRSDIPKNLISGYDYFNLRKKLDVNNKERYKILGDTLREYHIDGAIAFLGPMTSSTQYPHTWKIKELSETGEKIPAKTAGIGTYTAPLVYIFNELNIPWVALAPDPRPLKQWPRDMINIPKIILSQYNTKTKFKTMKSFEEQLNYIRHEIEVTYSGLEQIILMNYTEKKYNKKRIIDIVCNETSNGLKSRYEPLKEYILDNFDDVNIYGRWPEEIIEKDNRFKGLVPFFELTKKILPQIKYTFLIPIDKGWVTAKYAEMISKDIIPFFHPEYDEQNHLNVPNFLRIKSPEDLKKKIALLEKNKEAYEKLLITLKKEFLTEDIISGKKLVDKIMNKLYNYTVNDNKKKFIIKEKSDFSLF